MIPKTQSSLKWFPTCVNNSDVVTSRLASNSLYSISGRWFDTYCKHTDILPLKAAFERGNINKILNLQMISNLHCNSCFIDVFFFFQRPLQQFVIDFVYMQQAGGGSPEEACCVYDLVGFHIYGS